MTASILALEASALDGDVSRAVSARQARRAALARVLRPWRAPKAVFWLIAGLWFTAVFAGLLWIWGLNPVVFPSPDEAVVRLSASLVGRHGHPFIELPFADPEDLAHPRSWVTLGRVAVPTYAPVMLYAYAPLLRLGIAGSLCLMALPAAAAAAFAVACAELLPARRRWLALFAPLLAFPALYWLMRPWANLSAVLICLCWSVLYWALWRNSAATRWLVAAALSVAAAAAVRPDCAAFLLADGLLLTLAARLTDWRKITLVFVAVGAGALSLNLLLNHVLTGHAFRAAYQIALERDEGPSSAGSGLPGLGLLRVLVMPMGWPDPSIAWTAFIKYWFKMGPIGVLSVAQLAIVALLLPASRLSRVLVLGALLFAAFFVYTHLHNDVFGGQTPDALAEHSVPRYLSPIYLFVALPPLLLLGRSRQWFVLWPGVILCCLVSADAAYEIGVREPTSFAAVADSVRTGRATLAVLTEKIPGQAMVYSARFDKLLWSRWRLGTITANAEASAQSVSRALRSGLTVYVFEQHWRASSRQQFSLALARRRLALQTVDRRRGLFRVEREP